MVFACSIMDLDMLYVAYNVPTIGICRAEQREKACQKLGIPAPNCSFDVASPTYYKVHSCARQASGRACVFLLIFVCASTSAHMKACVHDGMCCLALGALGGLA